MSPDALTLLASLRKAGLRVRAAEGKLLVSPADRLTAEQRAAIAAHRDDLLALVGAEVDPFDVPPPEALWGRGPPYPSLPTFDPLPPLEPGTRAIEAVHSPPRRRMAAATSAGGVPLGSAAGGPSAKPRRKRSAGGGSSSGSVPGAAGDAKEGFFGEE